MLNLIKANIENSKVVSVKSKVKKAKKEKKAKKFSLLEVVENNVAKNRKYKTAKDTTQASRIDSCIQKYKTLNSAFIAEKCNVSKSRVYKRINALKKRDAFFLNALN